ncbi:MAG: hypothetical protein JSS22_09395 [Proteobacteria bacterium]|nr:hypothetical protein [Pseudomonadota bacterium]
MLWHNARGSRVAPVISELEPRLAQQPVAAETVTLPRPEQPRLELLRPERRQADWRPPWVSSAFVSVYGSASVGPSA